MAQYRVLVSCPLIQDAIGDYASRFDEYDIAYDVVEVDQQLSEGELLDLIEEYQGVIAGDDEFTRRVFEAASNLQVISKWGIGIDGIDTDAADDHDVAVYNTPGAFRDEVADIVIGYTIVLTRQLHRIDWAIRSGDWISPRGTSLAGKTFGVIGVGSIGSAVARRAYAHGMDVRGNDVRELPEELVEDIGIRAVGRDELLDEADVVSLNCALTEDTRNLIGPEEFDLLGPDGYLINTARGELVDEAALVEALADERLAGAGLDVFIEEPLPADHRLTEFDNVILGSHNAQNTHEAVSDVNDIAVENLIEGLTESG